MPLQHVAPKHVASTAMQEAELQKEQQEAQREAQEWSARAQCSAIDALSPEQAAAGDEPLGQVLRVRGAHGRGRARGAAQGGSSGYLAV